MVFWLELMSLEIIDLCLGDLKRDFRISNPTVFVPVFLLVSEEFSFIFDFFLKAPLLSAEAIVKLDCQSGSETYRSF